MCRVHQSERQQWAYLDCRVSWHNVVVMDGGCCLVLPLDQVQQLAPPPDEVFVGELPGAWV